MKRRVQHGTTAQYQWERKAGLEPCAACKAANARYVAEWRESSGDKRGRIYRQARGRATERLVRAHRAEFADLLRSELEATIQEAVA